MTRLVLIGMKGSGKSTVGRALAERLRVSFLDLDQEIEQDYTRQSGQHLTVRQLYERHGADEFRALETRTLERVCAGTAGSYVLATGGGTPLSPRNQALLRQIGTILFLDAAPDLLLTRLASAIHSPIFSGTRNPEHALNTLLAQRLPAYTALAEITVKVGNTAPAALVDHILALLARE